MFKPGTKDLPHRLQQTHLFDYVCGRGNIPIALEVWHFSRIPKIMSGLACTIWTAVSVPKALPYGTADKRKSSLFRFTFATAKKRKKNGDNLYAHVDTMTGVGIHCIHRGFRASGIVYIVDHSNACL